VLAQHRHLLLMLPDHHILVLHASPPRRRLSLNAHHRATRI
jgi:hypothetical protein